MSASHKLKSLVFAALLGSVSLSAQAVKFDYSGFVTIGMGQLDKDRVKFADYDNQLSFNTDTRMGFQIDAEITDDFSVIAQPIVKAYSVSDPNDDYQAEIDWAYLSYRLTPSVKLRVGRLRVPQYMVSDYLQVGYGYHWVRPPVDVYLLRAEPFNHYQGGEIFYSGKYRGYEINFQAMYGSFSEKTADIEVSVDQMTGLNFSATGENFTFRYAYLLHNVDLDVPDLVPLVDGFMQVGDGIAPFDAAVAEEFYAIARMYEISDEPYTYQAGGIKYELENWLIYTEFSLVDSSNPFGSDSKNTYFSVAYQFENLTPYFFVSSYSNTLSDQIENAINATYESIGREVNDGLNQLRDGGLQSVQRSNLKQKSLAIGLRYDFYENMDLKFEAMKVFPEEIVGGQLSNDGLAGSDNFPNGERFPNIVVYSFTFDYIF